jgi:hypothetical protein
MGTTEAPTMTMKGLESASPVPGSLFQTQMHCGVILNLARAMRDAPLRRKEVLFIGSRLATGGEWIVTGGDRRYCRDEMMKELLGSNVTLHVVDPVGVITASVQGPGVADYRFTSELPLAVLRQLSPLIEQRLATAGARRVRTASLERLE